MGFFVRQYRTKLSQRVQLYLNSKKLSLDECLTSVKHGHRGDIMLVYVLSIMKGLHVYPPQKWQSLEYIKNGTNPS